MERSTKFQKSWIFFRLLTQLHKLRSQLRGSLFIWFHFRSSYMIYFIHIYHIHLLNTQLTSSSWLEHRTSIARSRIQIPLKSWQNFLKNDISRSPSKICSFSGFRWVSHPFLLISFWSNRKGPKIQKPRESIIFAGFVSQKIYSIVTYDWLELRCKSPPWGLFSDHYNDKYELGVILLLVRGSFLKGIFIKMFSATKTKYAYFGVFTCLLPLRYWMSHVRQK